MKKFLWAVVFFFSFTLLYADSGECIKYKARFKLRNGRSVVGYFNYCTYDSLIFKFTDKSFNTFIDKILSEPNEPRDTLLIFLKIQTLKYPKVPPAAEGQFQYQAAAKKDILKIPHRDIVTSHFIEYLPPFEWNLSKEHWIFGCSERHVIEELTQREIDLLQHPPVAYYNCIASGEVIQYEYELLSYNSKINEKELFLFCERLKGLDSVLKNCTDLQNKYACYEREYNKIKKELMEKNVILFH